MACSLEVVADRTLAQSEALAGHPLRQMVLPSQPQEALVSFALTISDQVSRSLLLGKRPKKMWSR
jgi:hypothetical protein